MKKIIFNSKNKTFTLLKNTEKGEVHNQTIFKNHKKLTSYWFAIS